jgi:hypothetical protein
MLDSIVDIINEEPKAEFDTSPGVHEALQVLKDAEGIIMSLTCFLTSIYALKSLPVVNACCLSFQNLRQCVITLIIGMKRMVSSVHYFGLMLLLKKELGIE